MTSARDLRILCASAGIAALFSATVSACGTPATEPSEGSTSSKSAAPSPSESSSAGPKTVDASGASLKVPADWLQYEEGKSTVFTPPNDASGFDTARTVFSVKPGLWEGTPAEIDDLGDDELTDMKNGPGVKDARRLPDLKVNGATLFHIQAEDSTEWLDVFGSLNGDERVTVSWVIHKSTGNRKEADAMIDPVMQTFKFS